MADSAPSNPRTLTFRIGIGGGTALSIQRRLHDARFASRYFVGHGLDIGGGSESYAGIWVTTID